MTGRKRESQPLQSFERLEFQASGSLRLAVVSDTHSAPHPLARALLAQLRPDAILHAGDIGELRVLEELATVCQVFAVRGNIDARRATLPDVLVLEVGAPEQLALRLLMLHVGVYGPKLRAEVARKARDAGAAMVVCGHSHIPFIGQDRGIAIFNPGSVGPRRFSLPIVLGVIDISVTGIQQCHIDCETGQPWEPPA